MKGVITWVIENTLVASGLVVVAAVGAGLYQSCEVDGSSYRLFAQEWDRSGDALRRDLMAAMDDGKLSRWENTRLMRELLDEHRIVAFPETPAASLQQERIALLRKLEAGRGRP